MKEILFGQVKLKWNHFIKRW